MVPETVLFQPLNVAALGVACADARLEILNERDGATDRKRNGVKFGWKWESPIATFPPSMPNPGSNSSSASTDRSPTPLSTLSVERPLSPQRVHYPPPSLPFFLLLDQLCSNGPLKSARLFVQLPSSTTSFLVSCTAAVRVRSPLERGVGGFSSAARGHTTHVHSSSWPQKNSVSCPKSSRSPPSS